MLLLWICSYPFIFNIKPIQMEDIFMYCYTNRSEVVHTVISINFITL